LFEEQVGKFACVLGQGT